MSVSPRALWARISCAVVVALVAQYVPVPIGQLESGAALVTAMPQSLSAGGRSSLRLASATVTTRVSSAPRVYPGRPVPDRPALAQPECPAQSAVVLPPLFGKLRRRVPLTVEPHRRLVQMAK